MATADRSAGAPDASAVAAACREAGFVHLVARADGDALAAAGILAGALRATGTPYQASVVRTREELSARLPSTEGTPLVVGADAPGAESIVAPAAAVHAHETAAELGSDPDPIHALAGAVAAGETPGRVGAGLLERADLERHPGVAAPTKDPADVAYATLVHAEFSGDPEAARAVFDGIGSTASREAASLLALSVAGDADASERAATAVERALRPHVGGPLATLEGYADVLSVLSRTAPGLGIALVLGRDVRESALSAWREHGRAAHEGARSASTARYDGLLVARTGGPVEPVAWLLRDFRSPEPAALAVGDGEAAIAAPDPPGDAFEAAAERAGGSALTSGPGGYARIEPDRTEAFVDAVRGER